MVKEITSVEEFYELINEMETEKWNYKGNKKAILDFYDVNCAPCGQMVHTLNSIDKEYDIDIFKICCSNLPKIASMFQIGSVPTLFFQTSDKTTLPENIVNPDLIEIKTILDKLV